MTQALILITNSPVPFGLNGLAVDSDTRMARVASGRVGFDENGNETKIATITGTATRG
jgi:hypothetical protein